jgi:hypothetical protein
MKAHKWKMLENREMRRTLGFKKEKQQEDRKLKEYHTIVLLTKIIRETISGKMSGTCNTHIKCWPKQLNGGDAVGDKIKKGATVLQ